MRYHTAVAFKSTFDATFPDLRDVRKGEDRIPGRPLGELVVQGLRNGGLEASGPFNEEPFFVVPCRSGKHEYRVMCYLLEPGPDPVWAVECPRKLGLIAKWRGQSEEPEVGAVVSAIHHALKNDPRVKEMRWFQELPGNPFEGDEYDTEPIATP